MTSGIYTRTKPPWNKGKKNIYSKEIKKKMGSGNRGKPSWNTGKKLSEVHCKNLSESHKGNPGYWIGKKRIMPWLKDRKLSKGENHYKWIKDRTKLKDDHKVRGGQLHKEWSSGVKKRDGWKCKINNCDCKGRLESHHILSWRDYPELRYEINNGITLCHAHHPRKRSEEVKLSSFFRNLVAEMK